MNYSFEDIAYRSYLDFPGDHERLKTDADEGETLIQTSVILPIKMEQQS